MNWQRTPAQQRMVAFMRQPIVKVLAEEGMVIKRYQATKTWRRWTDEDLLHEVADRMRELGRQPTVAEMGSCRASLHRRFGGMGEAVRQAGQRYLTSEERGMYVLRCQYCGEPFDTVQSMRSHETNCKRR